MATFSSNMNERAAVLAALVFQPTPNTARSFRHTAMFMQVFDHLQVTISSSMKSGRGLVPPTCN